AARGYAAEAAAAYARWGATTKLTRPSGIRFEPAVGNAMASVTRSSDSVAERVELSTILRAAQTLSAEIVLSSLLEKMMLLLIEHVGPERGCLFLVDAGQLRVAAASEGSAPPRTYSSARGSSMYDEPFAAASSVINYVRRTQKLVLLDDACSDDL